MQLLTVEEAAERLSVGPKQVRALISAGRLAAVNVAIGKLARWRIKEEAIDTFDTFKSRTVLTNYKKWPMESGRAREGPVLGLYQWPMHHLRGRCGLADSGGCDVAQRIGDGICGLALSDRRMR